LGYGALSANTTADFNTAVGEYALVANTTGEHNTGIGKAVLLQNTTGGSNVAIGNYALDANTTANNNTAVGQAALTANTTGYANTALGSVAGDAITTGYYNTCLGHDSGSSTVLMTTALGCSLVGTFCHTSAADSSYANGFGYDISAVAGYTTVGKAGDDIAAAHGNVTWATVSDERVKKDIQDATAGLAFINDLRPVTFNYKNKGDIPPEFIGYEEGSTEAYKNPKEQHGFIAQEVKATIDKHSDIKDGFSMWDTRENDQQRVGETAVIPMLTKAIQELSAKVEALESQPKCKCKGE
jgi:hypothetical protein